MILYRFSAMIMTSALLFCASSQLFATESSIVGHAVSVSGQVLIRNDSDSHILLRKLKVGSAVAQGDVINTSSQGSVKLLMADQTILDLGGSTLFKVNEYLLKPKVADRQISMTLQYGQVRTSVQVPVGKSGYFKIHTKAAVMGVRGTEFIVQSALYEGSQKANRRTESSLQSTSSTPQMQVTVIQGKVEVSQSRQPTQETAPPPIEVTAGKQLVALADTNHQIQTTTVTSLSPVELQHAVDTGRVVDQTFKQAISLDPSESNSTSTTLSAVGAAIAVPNQGLLPLSMIGIGTPGWATPLVVPNQSQIGNKVTLQVVFKR